MHKKSQIRMTVAGLLVLVAFISAVFISQFVHVKKGVDVDQFHGTFLDVPRKIKAFSLTGIDHLAFNHQSLQGHWTMVFFGFTNCGSICPTTMAELAKMYRLLEEKGVHTLPQVVMISVDPERDSVEKLQQYVKAFHPDFYGARGQEADISLMTKEMGIVYTKISSSDHKDPQNDNIEHTGTIMLFNPDGDLNAFFTMPHQASLLAEDYLMLLSSFKHA